MIPMQKFSILALYYMYMYIVFGISYSLPVYYIIVTIWFLKILRYLLMTYMNVCYKYLCHKILRNEKKGNICSYIE